MSADFQRRVEAVDNHTLTPLVRQLLRDDRAEIVSWNKRAVSGGTSSEVVGGYGAYYFEGTARSDEEVVPWLLILKVLGKAPEAGSEDPHDWNYWKREILVYQSDLLADLSGHFSAPRCFGVIEYPDQEYWIWLEGITDAIGELWPLEQYGIAARHLGQFNAAYLLGRPLPTYSWLTEGRVNNWLAAGEAVLRDLDSIVQNAQKSHWLTARDVYRILNLWADRQRLTTALARLPRTFCHHDAFRRNLFTQKDAAALEHTVAIDWQVAGIGAVGEEIAPLISVSLQFMHVEMKHAKDLEEVVFAGYVEGLRDAGCQVDARLVRFGYAASASLFLGVGGVGLWLPVFSDEKWHGIAEKIIGHPVEAILETFAGLQQYLLDLGEEAQQLVDYTK
jgi:hypothetical protein